MYAIGLLSIASSALAKQYAPLWSAYPKTSPDHRIFQLALTGGEMGNTAKMIVGASALTLLLSGLVLAPRAYAAGEMPSKKVCSSDPKDPVVAGGCIATDRKKGNCMACHRFAGLEETRLQAGNIAPPLAAMKSRYPDKAKLREKIWDATKSNPNVMMPPFGKHKILSEDEIDKVVEWVSTL